MHQLTRNAALGNVRAHGSGRERVTSASTLLVLLTACGPSSTATDLSEKTDTFWQSFTVEEMQADRSRQNVPYVTFMSGGPFRLGMLHVPRSSETDLITHGLNAVYYVVSGEARISTENDDVDVVGGHVLYVRGDVEHRIRDVSEDLDIVVVFRIATLNPTDPEFATFAFEEMIVGESLEHVVWNPLLSTVSVGMGMYIVPKGIEEDALMRHGVDEFKIVFDGTSRFDLGAGSVRADPGTIAYIPNSVQHQFRRVADPLRVLVVFER